MMVYFWPIQGVPSRDFITNWKRHQRGVERVSQISHDLNPFHIDDLVSERPKPQAPDRPHSHGETRPQILPCRDDVV